MPSDPAVLDAFIQEASSSAKYAQIAPILVSRIAREEFNRHKSKKMRSGQPALDCTNW